MAVSVSKKSTQDAVYTVLKEGIMTLSLPPGTAMSTQEVATRLNVSRTPVREAFIRLHEEGLVDVFPQRQTIVSRIDFRRVMQERFIRESLETAALHLFMETRPEEYLARMQEEIALQGLCQKEKRFPDFIRHDNEMHRLIFLGAGQPLAWDAVLSVNGNYDRFRVLTVSNEDTLDSAIRQHRRLIALIREGDTQRACAEMYDHVRKLRYEKEELLRQYPDYFTTDEEAPDVFRLGALQGLQTAGSPTGETEV